ncbi:MAG: MBL fold metallo-hydrolase [SAR86 cluster bacterium]|nr:MBL fold metallo-hydrolase [SAR86 cluster bacterium]|tara:strand:- start:2998 stop:3969 length:972 start_codon:yes stop_codon:yes gene_type:complete
MKKFLVGILFISNLLMASNAFVNTNNVAHDKSFQDFIKWTFSGKNPKRVKIETSQEWKSLDESSKDYAVWIGHATFLLNSGGINILTDPVFSKRASPIRFAGPKRLIPPAISLEELPKIDVITVSHNHYDHLDIASLKKLFRLNPDVVFLVPKGDKKLLTKKGIKNIQEFLWWEKTEVKGTEFIFTPVQHWSSRGIRDRNKSLWGGWFMKSLERSLYHAGDTGYSQDFKETRNKLGSPDIAMIPIGAYDPQWFMSFSHVNPSEAIKIAKDLGVPRSFGMHWGTFILTDEDVLEPSELLKLERENLNLSEDFFSTPLPGEIILL